MLLFKGRFALPLILIAMASTLVNLQTCCCNAQPMCGLPKVVWLGRSHSLGMVILIATSLQEYKQAVADQKIPPCQAEVKDPSQRVGCSLSVSLSLHTSTDIVSGMCMIVIYCHVAPRQFQAEAISLLFAINYFKNEREVQCTQRSIDWQVLCCFMSEK